MISAEDRVELEHLIETHAKVCGPSNYTKTWVKAIAWTLGVAGAIFILGLVRLESVASANQTNKEDIAAQVLQTALTAKDVAYIKETLDRIERKLDGPNNVGH